MPRSTACPLALAVLMAATGAGCAETTADLPQLDLPEEVTVSGISSGAFFAHQFHVAYSDLVEGAAIVAGGPYACAEAVPLSLRANPTPQVATAVAVCTRTARKAFGPLASLLPDAPDADDAVDAIEEASGDDGIADPSNIADDRVWLFHGGQDDTVPEGSIEAVEDVYRALGVRGDSLETVRRRDAAHGFPVEATGGSDLDAADCGETASPYLIDCDLDAAGLLLAHLHGDLEPPVTPVREHLRTFDQTPFFDTGDDSVSLAEEGFLYVPEACAEGAECRLHVAFHGCRQGASEVGDDFVWGAGYNGWAEANRIVVLYPRWSRGPARSTRPASPPTRAAAGTGGATRARGSRRGTRRRCAPSAT